MKIRIASVIFLVIAISIPASIAHAAPANQSNSIKYGETVKDKVTNSDGDRWVFLGKSGDKIEIFMDGSNGLDSYLYFYGPSGSLIKKDDDSGGQNDSLITGYTLTQSGTYTIVAKGYGSSTGDYSLSLILLSTTSGNSSSSQTISSGQTVNDKVTSSSGDKWVFVAAANDTVTVSMKGISNFDTLLELYGPSGQLLASDDDGGDGSNSLISNYRLTSSGNYTIVARGFKGANGSYSLTFQKKQGTTSGSSSTPPNPSVIMEAVADYWDNVSDGDYRNAWSGLTPTFKERMHDSSYDDYVDGYNDMQICSIGTDNIRMVGSTPYYAIVSGDVIYRNHSNCARSVYRFDHFMVYDPSHSKWLLEGVAVRKSGVSDEDMTSMIEITTQAARSEITADQAEREMEYIISDVGVDAFSWLVRHLPVYDSDTGWHSFEDYMKDLTSSTSPNDDSRISQDPIGVGIDLIFGNPDSGDILDWLGFDD